MLGSSKFSTRRLFHETVTIGISDVQQTLHWHFSLSHPIVRCELTPRLEQTCFVGASEFQWLQALAKEIIFNKCVGEIMSKFSKATAELILARLKLSNNVNNN